MSKSVLPSQELSPNSRKLLAYAVLGYLHRFLIHRRFNRYNEGTGCLHPDQCRPFTVCGHCDPLNTDAFDIFGLAPFHEDMKHAGVPAALRDAILSFDEFGLSPRENIEATIRCRINAVLEFLKSEPENDVRTVWPVFKLFEADRPR